MIYSVFLFLDGIGGVESTAVSTLVIYGRIHN